MSSTPRFRIENDLLGEENVPHSAYYGIQTQRALRNFDITGVPISHFPELIRALVLVKQANGELGLLGDAKTDAIENACMEIADGAFRNPALASNTLLQFRISEDQLQSGQP
jgi:aspartate ammonia-lyase